jgi:outer membrane receptor protein involved in Fe transport
MLTANLSARYDDYKNVDAGSDSRTTYKAGLEFRPVDSWLFRASYATCLPRARHGVRLRRRKRLLHDRHRLLPLRGAGAAARHLRFRNSNIQGKRSGNPDLKSITADFVRIRRRLVADQRDPGPPRLLRHQDRQRG